MKAKSGFQETSLHEIEYLVEIGSDLTNLRSSFHCVEKPARRNLQVAWSREFSELRGKIFQLKRAQMTQPLLGLLRPNLFPKSSYKL